MTDAHDEDYKYVIHMLRADKHLLVLRLATLPREGEVVFIREWKKEDPTVTSDSHWRVKHLVHLALVIEDPSASRLAMPQTVHAEIYAEPVSDKEMFQFYKVKSVPADAVVAAV